MCAYARMCVAFARMLLTYAQHKLVSEHDVGEVVQPTKVLTERFYGMARHGTARHGTARHGTARHGMHVYLLALPVARHGNSMLRKHAAS